jgi:hypothetical protein
MKLGKISEPKKLISPQFLFLLQAKREAKTRVSGFHFKQKTMSDVPQKRAADLKEDDADRDLNPPAAKTIKHLGDLLECPVCNEIPREGPITSCKNGHLLCKICKSKLTNCPICREKEIDCRNLVMEQVIELTMADVQMNCRFKHDGCKVTMLIAGLAQHETICSYRDTKCPAVHQGRCDFNGSFKEVLKHCQKGKCIQIAQKKADLADTKQFFRESLGNFPSTSLSLFKILDKNIHWKPIILITKELLPFLMYFLIQRRPNGIWYLQMRAHLPQEMCDLLGVKIVIQGGTGGPNGKTRNHVYQGPITSASWTNEQAAQLGRYLILDDDQVKNCKNQDADQHIFVYNLTINIPEALKQKVAQDPAYEKLGIGESLLK